MESIWHFFPWGFFFVCALDWYQNGIFKNVFLLELAMFLALDSKKRSANVSVLFLSSSPLAVSSLPKIKEKTLFSSSSLAGQSYRFPLFVNFSNGRFLMIFRYLMHQSIPPAPRPPPGWPPGISIFFALDGKFPGVGTLELSNAPGWGQKKRANAPSSVNTVTFFIDLTVK